MPLYTLTIDLGQQLSYPSIHSSLYHSHSLLQILLSSFLLDLSPCLEVAA
jgi:hypothetical protein